MDGSSGADLTRVMWSLLLQADTTSLILFAQKQRKYIKTWSTINLCFSSIDITHHQ